MVLHWHCDNLGCVESSIDVYTTKQGDTNVNEYEVFIEDINSCDGA